MGCLRCRYEVYEMVSDEIIDAMRILIYGINFSPELTGIGKYSGEMAEWLVAHGHKVRVVTAPHYYPQWRVAGPNRWR